MPEPLDPFERRVADSLHGRRPTVTPDVVGARAVFLERRRRRERKRKLLALAASGSSALTITLIAMLLNFGSAGSPSDSVGLAGGSTASEQPSFVAPDGIHLLPYASPTPTTAPAPNASATTGTTAKPSSEESANAVGQPIHGGGAASAAPGVTSTTVPSPSPKPTATSSCSTAKEVTAGDSAECYVLHVGETLRVSYDESYWSDPETSDEKVLKTGESSHVQCVTTPCYGTMLDFIGNSVGTATVSAYGDPCKTRPADQPMCGAPVQLWDITVHVIA